MKKVLMKLSLVLVFGLAFTVYGQAQIKTEREWHNLRGPVHTVRVEVVHTYCEKKDCVKDKRLRSVRDTYDCDGNVTSSNDTCFDPDNPAIRLQRYPFGDQSPTIEKLNFTPDGKLASIERFSYDNANRQAEWASFYADGTMDSRVVYSYDANGRLADCTTYNSDMQVSSRSTHTYDRSGNEVEGINYSENNVIESVISYEYEFDEFGNWIQRLRTIKSPRNGQLHTVLKSVHYRTITYYYERLSMGTLQ